MNQHQHTQRPPGIVQWFGMNEHDRVKKARHDIIELGVTELRLSFSWAEWEMDGGVEWFDWYIPHLAKNTDVRLFPSLLYTPPEKALPDRDGIQRTSHPPKDAGEYVRFTEEMISRYGEFFDWVQVWNEPNWKPYWNWDVDPDWKIYADMATRAAKKIHTLGKHTALGGLTQYDAPWFSVMRKHGTLEHMNAVGIHWAPSWPDRRPWYGWDVELDHIRALLAGYGLKRMEVWIAETGYSTPPIKNQKQEDTEREQKKYFDEVRALPADKIFWYSLYDEHPRRATMDTVNTGETKNDPIAYYFGIKTLSGEPKLLFDHWKELYSKDKK